MLPDSKRRIALPSVKVSVRGRDAAVGVDLEEPGLLLHVLGHVDLFDLVRLWRCQLRHRRWQRRSSYEAKLLQGN